ncbi:lytic transglycosylase domain-containing protein [Caulobacter sp. RHG1]|uniref:lytic transglycosylase domain-containing protein n=1 Tax=Caulobacter sp. (strain RHG1) TaxID=2545762 RepID=UPI00351B666F
MILVSAVVCLAPLSKSHGATVSAREGMSIPSAVEEAAARFRLPPSWIYAVIAAESGGDARAVSPKGAMGLMQLMPATWRALSAEHGLGADPFDRRSNVLAGAAYLRELYDRFGADGFLAAYNAGPGRYAEARDGRRQLPAETLIYVARVERSILDWGEGAAAWNAPRSIDWRAAGLFASDQERIDQGTTQTLFVGVTGRVAP